MTTHKEALTLALEAFRKIQRINWNDGLEGLDKPTDFAERQAAIFALGDAKIYALKAIEDIELTLAQPEQRSVSEHLEPVAWMNVKRDMTYLHGPYNANDIPLYTTPPQRKSLTMFDTEKLAKQCRVEWTTDVHRLCCLAAAHGIKGEA